MYIQLTTFCKSGCLGVLHGFGKLDKERLIHKFRAIPGIQLVSFGVFQLNLSASVGVALVLRLCWFGPAKLVQLLPIQLVSFEFLDGTGEVGSRERSSPRVAWENLGRAKLDEEGVNQVAGERRPLLQRSGYCENSWEGQVG